MILHSLRGRGLRKQADIMKHSSMKSRITCMVTYQSEAAGKGLEAPGVHLVNYYYIRADAHNPKIT